MADREQVLDSDDRSPANHNRTDRSISSRRSTHHSDLALEQLYQNHLGELVGYLRKAFGNGPPDPEDIAQEAFSRLAAQQDLSLIDNMRAFLWRTARNLLISQRRSAVARGKYDFEIEHLFFAIKGPGLSPESVLEAKEQLEIIDKALNIMPERRRKAFLWHRIDGLSFTDIGRKLGIDRRAVVRHISIAATDIEIALSKAMELRG